MKTPAVEIKNIYKSFGKIEMLKGVNLKVEKGDVVTIIGPSGIGKTTLLRCINYLDKTCHRAGSRAHQETHSVIRNVEEGKSNRIFLLPKRRKGRQFLSRINPDFSYEF